MLDISEYAKFRGSSAIVDLGRCALVGPKYFSRGYFMGVNLFLVCVSLVQDFFLVSISWVQDSMDYDLAD